MINKIVTIDLLCFTILLFELFFIYLNQKNVINPFYVKLYFIIIVIELLLFLLSSEKFTIFFDNSMVVAVEYLNVSIHLIVVSFLCFIYNILFPKLNRNLPILYNCSLLFFYIFIFIGHFYGFYLSSENVFILRLFIYLVLVFSLIFILLDFCEFWIITFFRSFNNWKSLSYYSLIIVNTMVLVTGSYIIIQRFDVSRFSFEIDLHFSNITRLFIIFVILLLLYLVCISFTLKTVALLILSVTSFCLILLMCYCNYCFCNYEPFLVNFDFCCVRINYTCQEQFDFLANVWNKQLKSYYGANFENEIYKLIAIYSKKTNISLDILEHDFRCSVHIFYKHYLKYRYIF